MAALDATHALWQEIDGVLVVNMDACADRFLHLQETVGRSVPSEKWHRLPAVAGRELPTYGKAPWFTGKTGGRAKFWGGTAGCALSHRRAIETAKKNNWRHVMVLEDDVRLAALPAEAWDVVHAFLQDMAGKKFLLYLGGSRPVPFGRMVRKGRGCDLWKIDGLLGTYAYIVPAALYDDLLALMPQEDSVWEWLSIYRAADVFFRDFVSALPGVGLYAVSPVLVEQDAADSVIAGGAAAQNTDVGAIPPKNYFSFRGFCHYLARPFHRVKVRLNSIRTHRRALRGGLPGHRKRRK